MLPVQAFIEEIKKLQNTRTDPRLPDLQPLVKDAIDALQTLQDLADELPDLSAGRWFLQARYLAARDCVQEQIEVVKNSLLILSMKSNEWDDPFDIIVVAVCFSKFAKQAEEDPEAFRKPCKLEARLKMPGHQPAPLEDFLTDTSLDSTILPL